MRILEGLISLLLLLLVVMINPAFAAADKVKGTYTAVFCSQEFDDCWDDMKVDNLFIPKAWKDLDVFLDTIVAESGDKPIVIDLQVHGWDDGLYITTGYEKYAYTGMNNEHKIMEGTTFGKVINKITEKLGHRQLIVLCEACFAGSAYKNTINNPKYKPEYCSAMPPYPVIGSGDNFSNWGNTVYCQYLYNCPINFEDLRMYEVVPVEPHEKEDPNGYSVTTIEQIEIYNFFHKYSKKLSKAS